ncbi:MAG: tetratricopeptide repeat protein, partial [Micromonosporaceae bacterium]|nr:tetratricopeptide repeat protein [Micromonosporaceae bacterium]
DRDAATHLVALSDFMASQTESSHEHTDLADCCRGQAWLGQPGWASESAINALRQVPQQDRSGAGDLRVSQMEVPSALATVSRAWPGLQIGFPAPPAELITPLRDGPQLWRFDGTRLVPGVPPPARATEQLLLRTVTPSWPHPVAAYDQALPLGDLPAGQLVAALVHPPARPDQYGDLPEDWWVRSVQAFACVGLLHCRELIAPGDTRRARELLTQLAYGVEDWTTEAALFGLAVAAWAEPACRPEVAQTFADRYRAAAWAGEQHVVTIMPNLARLALIVPGLEEAARKHAHTVIEREESDETAGD